MTRCLVAVTSFFNPARFRKRLVNYSRFAAELRKQGVPLWTVEISFDGRWEIPQTDRVLRLRSDALLWHKEAALNVGIKTAIEQDRPAAVAWLDADLLWDNVHWSRDTLRALELHHVVQPWEQVQWLGGGGWRDQQASFARWRRGGHPGFAWAARVDWWRRVGGLFDLGVFGGGDRLMAGAWGSRHYLSRLSGAMRLAAAEWLDRASGSSLSYVCGRIQHLEHGSRANRRYAWRDDTLRRFNFDPGRHVIRDPSGLWRWSRQAPRELVEAVAGYFAQRKEDETCQPTTVDRLSPA